jgi:hypothetical protein
VPQSLLLLAKSELRFNKYYTFLSDAEEKIGAFDRTFKFKAYKSKPFKFDCYIYTASTATTSGFFEGISTISNKAFDKNNFFEFTFKE